MARKVRLHNDGRYDYSCNIIGNTGAATSTLLVVRGSHTDVDESVTENKFVARAIARKRLRLSEIPTPKASKKPKITPVKTSNKSDSGSGDNKTTSVTNEG